MSRVVALGALLVLLGSCTSDTGSSLDGGAARDASARLDASASCNALPDPSPPWMAGYLDDIVARLAGEKPIVAGLPALSDRATPSSRATTRDFLQSKLAEMGLVSREQSYGDGTNVYALFHSDVATTSRTIVIGAHFDSVPDSPGANDNATGVALVLALARYLTTTDCREHNFLFVLFDQEEIGLVGSFEFASWLQGESLDVLSVHTIDQMGWDNDGDRAIEFERASGNLFTQYQSSSTNGSFPQPLHQTNTGATDHVSFRQFGFAAIGLTEEFVNGDTTPHYHLSTDNYGTVNFGYLAATTEFANYHFGWLARNSASQFRSSRQPILLPGVTPHQAHQTLGCRAARGMNTRRFVGEVE